MVDRTRADDAFVLARRGEAAASPVASRCRSDAVPLLLISLLPPFFLLFSTVRYFRYLANAKFWSTYTLDYAGFRYTLKPVCLRWVRSSMYANRVTRVILSFAMEINCFCVLTAAYLKFTKIISDLREKSSWETFFCHRRNPARETEKLYQEKSIVQTRWGELREKRQECSAIARHYSLCMYWCFLQLWTIYQVQLDS